MNLIQEMSGKRHRQGNMAVLRCIITILVLCSALISAAQDSVATLYSLPEVIIASEPAKGTNLLLTDSIDRMSIRHEHIGSLLARKTGVYVMNYGPPGAAATIRWQGLSSSHTSVNWQGVPLSSRTLGVADLSLLPSALFEQASFHASSASFANLNTTIGGQLDLLAPPIAVPQIGISSSLNSMNNHQQVVRFQVSSGRWQIFGTSLWQNNANRFRYRDEMKFDRPWETQTSAPGHQLSVQQNASYTSASGRNRLYTSVWWNYRKTRLPEIMGNYTTGHQQQTDSSMRVIVGWQTVKQTVQISYSDEFQHYTDKLTASSDEYSIDSQLRIRQAIVQWNGELLQRGNSRLHAVFQGHSIHINNDAYTQGKANESYPAVGFFYEKKGRTQWRITGRYEHRKGFNNWPAAGVRMQHRLTGKSTQKTTAIAWIDLQRKFRVPDFNERFWVTGVDTRLRPEQGWHSQSGIEIKNSNAFFTIEGNLAAFVHLVNDWIQWLPTENNVWAPKNIKQVVSSGITTDVSFQKKTPYGRMQWRIGYQWNVVKGKNGNSSVEFIMPYSPEHMANAIVSWMQNNTDITVSARYIGKRFTEERNLDLLALNSVMLYDIRFGYTLEKNYLRIRLQAHVDNVANVQYQTVRSYAMPGRVIGSALSVEWKTKKTNT